jgi:uncharacterized membrane protein
MILTVRSPPHPLISGIRVMTSVSRSKFSILLMSAMLGVVGAIGSAIEVQAASFTSFSRGLLPRYPWGDDDSTLRERISGDGSTVIGGRFLPVPSQIFSDSYFSAYRWSQSSGFQLIGGPFLIIPSPIVRPSVGSTAVGVSTDGSIIVGERSAVVGPTSTELFQWNESDGSQTLAVLDGMFVVAGASGDVLTMVGQRYGLGAERGEAARWSSVGGIQELGYLSNDTSSYALDASDDGSTVVGTSGDREAFRWTQSGGMQGLGYLPDNNSSEAVATSGDGLTVVGSSFSNVGRFNTAFRWTEASGMQSLGDLPGGAVNSKSYGVSRDGSTVVGSSISANGRESFLWTQAAGMQSVQTLLTTAGLDLTGWELSVATDVSDDGLSLVGIGRNPNGGWDTWIARLDAAQVPSTTVPETTPITPLLAGLAAFGIGIGRKRNPLI